MILDLPATADGTSYDVVLTEDREPERIQAILTKYAGSGATAPDSTPQRTS